MISTENFKKLRIKDFIVILSFVILWALITFILNNNFSPQTAFIFSMFFITLLMSFTLHLVKKFGTVTLFCLLGGLLTQGINDLGIVGSHKVITFLVAGIIFELVFLILKLELKNIQLDIVLGTAIFASIIPLTGIFLLPQKTSIQALLSIIALSALSFFIGIIAAILSFLIWYHIKSNKLVTNFEKGF